MNSNKKLSEVFLEASIAFEDFASNCDFANTFSTEQELDRSVSLCAQSFSRNFKEIATRLNIGKVIRQLRILDSFIKEYLNDDKFNPLLKILLKHSNIIRNFEL